MDKGQGVTARVFSYGIHELLIAVGLPSGATFWLFYESPAHETEKIDFDTVSYQRGPGRLGQADLCTVN